MSLRIKFKMNLTRLVILFFCLTQFSPASLTAAVTDPNQTAQTQSNTATTSLNDTQTNQPAAATTTSQTQNSNEFLGDTLALSNVSQPRIRVASYPMSEAGTVNIEKDSKTGKYFVSVENTLAHPGIPIRSGMEIKDYTEIQEPAQGDSPALTIVNFRTADDNSSVRLILDNEDPDKIAITITGYEPQTQNSFAQDFSLKNGEFALTRESLSKFFPMTLEGTSRRYDQETFHQYNEIGERTGTQIKSRFVSFKRGVPGYRTQSTEIQISYLNGEADTVQAKVYPEYASGQPKPAPTTYTLGGAAINQQAMTIASSISTQALTLFTSFNGIYERNGIGKPAEIRMPPMVDGNTTIRVQEEIFFLGDSQEESLAVFTSLTAGPTPSTRTLVKMPQSAQLQPALQALGAEFEVKPGYSIQKFPAGNPNYDVMHSLVFNLASESDTQVRFQIFELERSVAQPDVTIHVMRTIPDPLLRLSTEQGFKYLNGSFRAEYDRITKMTKDFKISLTQTRNYEYDPRTGKKTKETIENRSEDANNTAYPIQRNQVVLSYSPFDGNVSSATVYIYRPYRQGNGSYESLDTTYYVNNQGLSLQMVPFGSAPGSPQFLTGLSSRTPYRAQKVSLPTRFGESPAIDDGVTHPVGNGYYVVMSPRYISPNIPITRSEYLEIKTSAGVVSRFENPEVKQYTSNYIPIKYKCGTKTITINPTTKKYSIAERNRTTTYSF